MEELAIELKKILSLDKGILIDDLGEVNKNKLFIEYGFNASSSVGVDFIDALKDELADSIRLLANVMINHIDSYKRNSVIALDKFIRNKDKSIITRYCYLVAIYVENYIKISGTENTHSNGGWSILWPDYFLSFKHNPYLRNLNVDDEIFAFSYVSNVFIIDVFKILNFNLESKVSNLGKIINESEGAFNERVRSANSELEGIVKTFNTNATSILDEKLEELKKIEERINKNNDAAIFVSLDQGYKNLFKSKKIEKWWAFLLVMILGALVFAPVVVKLSSALKWIVLPVYNIYGYIGSATVTFILLYYFRVAYLNYISIKTEITQIALRRNLCAFINGYVDFAERNKKAPEAFKQFENIIFSNIVSDAKNIPTTYDGIEQLANLINALKSTPK
ncbi:hypothetical protein ABN357_05785 [Providencia rettgeri]|uniref:hypothetical protein n=2 Tax=Morganellaceae TaxID=1903414 RepID=UPI00234B1ABA|nr:hypothetical protein [Providencia sp. PROV128]